VFQNTERKGKKKVPRDGVEGKRLRKREDEEEEEKEGEEGAGWSGGKQRMNE
jgi:hypothetical protein